MSGSLDDCKIEIRSILLPFQKGCYLGEFRKTYRDLIGRRFPSRDFGYQTDEQFLLSMPDVVRVTGTNFGECHLMGIANENTKHIQNMVARQKPAKLRQPYPRFTTQRYNDELPPRFQQTSRPRVSDSTHKFISNALKPATAKTFQPKTSAWSAPTESKWLQTSIKSESSVKMNPMAEVIQLVKKFKGGLARDDLLVEYKRMYDKNLSLSTYGFNSIEECIGEIPELTIMRRNSMEFIVCCSEILDAVENKAAGDNKIQMPSAKPSTSPVLYDSEDEESCSRGNIPDSLRSKFLKVAEKIADGGICASEFPNFFEEVTSVPLDFLSLGYRSLTELIDEASDIFIRKPVAGSRKDYIIIPANKQGANNPSFVDRIILNFRKILEAYPEGIKLRQILHIYSINCKDSLHIEDLGFDCLEDFLLSIRNSVPLTFQMLDGEKSVHLKRSFTIEDVMREPEYMNQKIPAAAVLPDFDYKPIVLPPDFNFETFIPVYVASVIDPDEVYIQFELADNSTAFKELATNIELFYNGKESDLYMMKDIHVKVGACCIAKWPSDGYWYRTQILSIPSMGMVDVIYVDYGTKDTISTKLLRYARKEFIDMPVQSMRCSLHSLRPPKNAKHWDYRARDRIIQLCHDISLMAKFHKQEDNFSVVLCNTHNKDDIFINDVLMEEGLAECGPSRNPSLSIEPPAQLQYHHNLTHAQATQARAYLHLFIIAAPSFTENEHYLALLKEINMCSSSNFSSLGPSSNIPSLGQSTNFLSLGQPANFPPLGQSANFPSLGQAANISSLDQSANFPSLGSAANIPSLVPPGFDPLTIYKNSNALNSNLSATNMLLEQFKSSANLNPSINSTDYQIRPPVENAAPEFNVDTFVDDDDELFRQFCEDLSGSAKIRKVRHVKRVDLCDGYKIHLIVLESTPYVSCGDASHLIWNNKDADFMYRRLQHRKVEFEMKTVSEDGHEDLFDQLRRYHVKGVQNTVGFRSSILLFRLKDIVRLLNLFGHPSCTLRKRLIEETAMFDPNDPYWEECSYEAIDDDDSNLNATDAEKQRKAQIEDLCLSDLMVMQKTLMGKKKLAMNNTKDNKKTDENRKAEVIRIDELLNRVQMRIREIENICNQYKVPID